LGVKKLGRFWNHKMIKILVCDELSEKGMAILKSIPDTHLDVKTGRTEKELIDLISQYEAVVVRSATKITAPVIEASKKLKVIARAGTGYDNIDIESATKKGIVVMNTPAANSVAAAEHTIAMMMALARNIPQAHQTLQEGKWDRKSFVGVELTGKCLGLIGFGNVGRHVALRARALKMEVLACDPFVSEKAADEAGVMLVSLDELYQRADFISIHSILNEATRHMVGKEAFSKMKNGMRVVNCARGGIIDEEALLKAIQEGKILGAALDVFEKEPVPTDHPLLHHSRVITTPHLGASTDEAQEQVVVAVAEQLRTYFTDEIVVNGVNVPQVSREVLRSIGNYIDLGQKMGWFLGQLEMSSVDEVHVECAGEILKYDTSPIVTGVLCGLMQQILLESINFVNAPIAAKERGIRVVESRVAEAGNYLSLVTVAVKFQNLEHRLSGSVFGKDHQRLVKFDHFYIEVVPKGHLLIIHNEDKPGTVASWSSILGRNNINISQMHLALGSDRKLALAIVNIDTPAPPHVIEELKKLPNIQSIRKVKL